MEKLTINYVPLNSLGFTHAKVPSDIILDLHNQANDIIDNNFENIKSHKQNLYGAIEKEFGLPNPTKLSYFVEELCKYFWLFEYNETNSTKKHSVNNVWINFQKKYEHNPLHEHDGDLSFVVWLKIPYDLENEFNHPTVKNSNNLQEEAAGFSFIYPAFHSKTPSLSGIQKFPIPMRKEREGEIILFKSSLQHIVYPFYTSDDYRISVSGNVYIEK